MFRSAPALRLFVIPLLAAASLLVPVGPAQAVEVNQLRLADMTVTPASAGTVVRPGASPDVYYPGDVLGLWANGTATGMVQLSSAPVALMVAARAAFIAATTPIWVPIVVLDHLHRRRQFTNRALLSTDETRLIGGGWYGEVNP